MCRILRCAFVLLLFLCLATCGAASPITQNMRAQDGRLEKRVSLVAYRLYVGELLERLSEQTGVRVSASDRDGAAGERVSVAFRSLPLADALNAVRSLFSYRNAAYRWERDGTEGTSWSYRLVRPRAAQELGATVAEAIQKDFEAEVLGKIALLSVSPEERRRAEQANPRSKVTPRGELAMAAVAGLLTSDQLQSVLRGKEEIRVPAEQFGEASRKFVGSEKELHERARNNSGAPHLVAPWTEPQAFVFKRSAHEGMLAPSFSVLFERVEKIGNASVISMEGPGWAGGVPLEQEWQKNLAHWWQLTADEWKPPALSPDKLAAPAQRETLSDAPHPIFVRLYQLARDASLSVVARVPHQERSDPGAPYDMSAAEFLEKLKASGLDYKWSNGTLVVTYHQWLQEEPESKKIPWSLVKRLRESAAKDEQHQLSLADLCLAASQLSEAQLEQMYRADQWHYDRWDDMRDVARLKALLSAFARKPSLLSEAASERGVSVSAFSSPVQKFLNDQPVRAARLRLEHRRYTPTEKPEQAERRLIRLSLLSAEGKPVSSYDLPLSPWSPLNRQPPRLVTSGVKRQSR